MKDGAPLRHRFVNAQCRKKVELQMILSGTSHPIYAIDVYTTLA